VASVAGFWKIPAEEIVVVHDELDLPFGRMKINKGGGAGGHNGVRSVIDALGTPDFVRVRVGIGRPPPNWEGADYVLADFTRAEQPEVPGVIGAAVEAVREIVTRGLTAAMNRYNVRPPNEKNDKKNGGGA
jgi:PTH1 family peptidyl-tRNA hydrolase